VALLWELSRDLPIFEYDLSRFTGLDEDRWYCSVNVPTIRSVLEHMQRIQIADLSQPIILNESGDVMDGIHRICKAILDGETTLLAVQFPQNPTPDKIEDWERSTTAPSGV
jgi:hypothetical protein